MTAAVELEELRNQIWSFFQDNERAHLLNCTGTNLLLALGGLLIEERVELKKEGWETIIPKTTHYEN